MTRRGAIRAGELKFVLHGERLRGRFMIVRTAAGGGRRDEREQWLLIHKRDEAAVAGWDADELPAQRQDRPHQRRGQGRRAAALGQPPPGPAEAQIDLSRRATHAHARLRAADAGDPDGAAFDDPDWLFEMKLDGYRVEAVVNDGRARLWTRNRQDAARYFPSLAGRRRLDRRREAIVDGEVVALDERGPPDFSLLQDRTGLRGLGWPPTAIRTRRG